MFGSAIAFAQIRRSALAEVTVGEANQSLGGWMIKRRTIEETPSFSIRELRGAGLLEEGVETLHLVLQAASGHISCVLIARKQVEILYATPHIACRRCHSLDFT
jgi:hypothetical protein